MHKSQDNKHVRYFDIYNIKLFKYQGSLYINTSNYMKSFSINSSMSYALVTVR